MDTTIIQGTKTMKMEIRSILMKISTTIKSYFITFYKKSVFSKNQKCFQSKGGRALVQIYRKYIIQAGTTFHGGDNVLSYPWGSRNHRVNNQESILIISIIFSLVATEAPDNNVFTRFSQIMNEATMANKNKQVALYRLGTMTDTVYSLNGAYEDWAYAAGWEHLITNRQTVSKCNSVPNEQYNSIEHKERCIIFLFETDFNKNPSSYTWGSSLSVEHSLQTWPPEHYRNQSYIDNSLPMKSSYGHVSRNIISSLALIDLLKPYIIVHEISNTTMKFRMGGCFHLDILQVMTNDSQKIKELNNEPCIWEDPQHIIQIPFNSSSYLLIRTDEAFKKQNKPDPAVSPQTFFMQQKHNQSFSVSVGEYRIEYQEFLRLNLSQAPIENIMENNETTQETNLTLSNINHKLRWSDSKADPTLYLLLFTLLGIGVMISFFFYRCLKKQTKSNYVQQQQ